MTMRPVETRRNAFSLSKAVNASSNFFFSEDFNKSRVCFLTSLTGVLLLLSVLLASYRRRSKSLILKGMLWASYTMTGYLIAFTMGQMLRSDSSKNYNSDNTVWAVYLLIAFGSADSFSSYSLLDSEQWRRYNWQFVLKLGGLVIILVPYFEPFGQPLTASITLLLILAIISKVSMKNQSIEASGMAALHRSGKLMADYMSTEHEAGDAARDDPLSMKGYRYLVQGPAAAKAKDIVTLEKVWSCRWELLSSSPTGERLKDMCVSFSLFRLLRMKYAGYKLPHEARQKTLRLVRHGLMVSEDNGYERAFRVVEDELALLFDSFYTKRPIIFEPRRLCVRFAEFLIIGLVSSFFAFALYPDVMDTSSWSNRSWTDGLYTITSFLAVTTYLLSEGLQFFLLLLTTWTKVTCICKYVKGDTWLNRPFRRKCVERICKLPSLKPWERKLHQYSLFESYAYSPRWLFCKRFVYMFIDYPRDGQEEGDPIDLSIEVSKAVFDCLKRAIDSQEGIACLGKPNVSNVLVSWEWDHKLETEAEVIMVWHIATSILNEPGEGIVSGRPKSLEGQTNFRVATSLSKYLAYLVAFAPRLLPHHPHITESLFDQTIAEARLLLEGCKTVTERVAKLRASVGDYSENDTTLVRGARLAKQLSDSAEELDVIWETLARFWVEMTLYVAPSKDDRAHADKLAYGGELVTHLWALLYHAGIKRSKGSMPSHRRTCSNSDAAAGSSTLPKTSELAVPPVSLEIKVAVVPPTPSDKKPE